MTCSRTGTFGRSHWASTTIGAAESSGRSSKRRQTPRRSTRIATAEQLTRVSRFCVDVAIVRPATAHAGADRLERRSAAPCSGCGTDGPRQMRATDSAAVAPSETTTSSAATIGACVTPSAISAITPTAPAAESSEPLRHVQAEPDLRGRQERIAERLVLGHEEPAGDEPLADDDAAEDAKRRDRRRRESGDGRHTAQGGGGRSPCRHRAHAAAASAAAVTGHASYRVRQASAKAMPTRRAGVVPPQDPDRRIHRIRPLRYTSRAASPPPGSSGPSAAARSSASTAGTARSG